MPTEIENQEEVLDSENLEDTAAEVTEDEDEIEFTAEDDAEDKPKVSEEVAQRRQSTIDRLKQERDEWKEKATKATASEELDIIRLEVRGVVNPEDQKEVLRFAKAQGQSPLEVLDDDFIKSRLAFNKKKREEKASTPTPGNRTAVSGKSVDWYISRGELPSDSEMRRKVQDELARRAKDSA